MKKKSPVLYDQSGEPIVSPSNDEDRNLPPGVQALIETRIHTAIDDIREHNRDDLQDLARENVRKWRYLALTSSAILLITLFIAPQQIVKWIGQQIDRKLTEPMLRNSADRLIESKMATYVDQKLGPLNKEADKLTTRISSLEKNISDRQNALQEHQEKLADQLHIRELAVAAKAGSRKAYVNLLGLAQTETETSDLLSASLKEIDLFYDADRNQLAFPILVETETLKDPGFSTDELVSVLRKKPQLAEAAVNSLSKLKSKAPVRELCTLVESTEDLRVATRATRALEQITGEKFRPLEFDKVRKWWEDNADNEVYLGNYNGYCYVVEKMFQGTISYEQLKDFVAKLCETADSDPKALHCQCLQAGFLIMLGRGDEAKSLFDEVRKEDQDYRWLHVWEAAAKIREGDQESALELLNKAFKKSPTSAVEETIKRWRIFDPIQNNEGLKWPSRESNAQQGAPTEAQ